MPGLTAKQRRFIEEYLVDLNATQAAVRAGYSKKTARFTGCENLTKPNIQESIAELMAERSKRTEITVDLILKQLGEGREFAMKLGNPGAAIRATELMGKHLGMFKSKRKPRC